MAAADITDHRDPFLSVRTQSRDFLEQVDGRTPCPKCGKSRKFYCYSCCILIGKVQEKLRKVKLPIKVDIIKHRNEVDGKSTAPHAAVISPDDVTLYIYPCIPDYDKDKVILVFPSRDSVTLEDLVDLHKSSHKVGGICDPKGSKCDSTEINRDIPLCDASSGSCDTKGSDVDTKGSDVDTKGSDGNAKGSDGNAKGSDGDAKDRDGDAKGSDTKHSDAVGKKCDTSSNRLDMLDSKVSIHAPKGSRCDTVASDFHSIDAAHIREVTSHSFCENMIHKTNQSQSELGVKRKLSENLSESVKPNDNRQYDKLAEDCKRSPELHTRENFVPQTLNWKVVPSFEKVVFIDSTWLQSKQIFRDERLKQLRHVELKTRESRYWRPQGDYPDTYLATIEAIYYFICDFHDAFISDAYHGEYDNLLFFFLYTYEKVQQSNSKKTRKNMNTE